MKPITKQTLKDITKDYAVITAAETIFIAMAYEQTVREQLEPIQQEEVEFWKFEVCEDMKRFEPETLITDFKMMYLASEEDRKLYWTCMNEHHNRLGFKKKSKDHCPILVAESQTRDAKRLLIDVLEPFTGINEDHLIGCMKHYKEYIELHLNLLAPFVNPHKYFKNKTA